MNSGISAGGILTMKMKKNDVVNLPDPARKGPLSLEQTLAGRESVRQFSGTLLTIEEISQLLWAAQGLTRKWGGRTAPSAGGLYPLEIFIVVPEGLFHYVPRTHKLRHRVEGDLRGGLASAALGQRCVREAPAVIVIAAVYERTTGKYGKRGGNYVKMEAGHAAQNILLQAVSLGLGAVPVGAFYDERVATLLELPAECVPLYLIPVGHPMK
jgi:SagB-type dehydrogenase family enzyme